jgi:hypothetical protein
LKSGFNRPLFLCLNLFIASTELMSSVASETTTNKQCNF